MAGEGQLIVCYTPEIWEEQLKKANETKKLIVVDFTATWCGPCKMMAPIFENLAKENPNVTFLKVDVDELKKVAEDWDVEAMPTFVFIVDGKAVDKVVGARKDQLADKIKQYAATTASASAV